MRNAKYYSKLQLGQGKEGNEALGVNEMISPMFLWGNKPKVRVLLTHYSAEVTDFCIQSLLGALARRFYEAEPWFNFPTEPGEGSESS